MGCYCGNEPSFDECCGRYVNGGAKPDTAEALMRSRYSGYAIENIDYVLATHDPATVAEVDREGAERWSREAEWTGLEVISTRAGQAGDQEGEVEFIAHYKAKGHPLTHHEHATFRRVDGDWYYIDGEMVKAKPLVRDQPKVGRNEPCPCGSGKKFKKCHGA